MARGARRRFATCEREPAPRSGGYIRLALAGSGGAAMTAEFDRKHEDHAHEKAKRRSEELDHALEDTFPASDPPSIVQPTKEEGNKPGKHKAE
jgi:hypothetical protein